MYAILAEDAMNRQQHVKAMEWFARARDLCPSGQYPEIDTLSLVRILHAIFWELTLTL